MHSAYRLTATTGGRGRRTYRYVPPVPVHTEKKRRGEERIPRQRRPRPPAVAVRRSPARGRRSRVAHGRFFSRARRRSVSPREKTDRGDNLCTLDTHFVSNVISAY
ncbi:hypothetical protein GW17_00038959 [Ensete ventricosum]|nr:hypothetical protein GW17_00038959 [Ensete ventricosum]